jgi:hypothetical protein
VAGLTGAAGGFGLQWWVHASAYPLVISGKPYFSWPAFIPITFELGVLFAAFGAVLGMLGLNRLPMHHHPLFHSKVFERVTDDAFFISLESCDPRFGPSASEAAGVAPRSVELWVLNDPERDQRQRGRAGHDPAGAPVEPPAGHCAAFALLGVVACRSGAANPKRFFPWLVSFLFFLSLAPGALFSC